ncbi:SAGA complex subunit Sgf73 [Schizosaccharomyces pombe]
MLTEQQTLELFPENWERNEQVLLKYPDGLPKDVLADQRVDNTESQVKDEITSNITNQTQILLPADSFPQYGSYPNNSELDYVVCTKCDRPFLSEYIEDHHSSCNGIKPPKPQFEPVANSQVLNKDVNNGNNAPIKNGVKSTAKGSAGNHEKNSVNGQKNPEMPPKRRKTEENKKPTKSALPKKEASKKKNPKVKGPVDVEKQCGVLLPNGQMCARSLTCKTHSMSSKRAVPGRSQPYDVLLAACQKKNQVKIQRQILETAKESEENQHQAPVDSDEEVSFIMNVLQKSGNQPLEQKVFLPVKRRHSYFRTRELIAAAFRHGEQGMQVTGTILGRVIPFSARQPL